MVRALSLPWAQGSIPGQRTAWGLKHLSCETGILSPLAAELTGLGKKQICQRVSDTLSVKHSPRGGEGFTASGSVTAWCEAARVIAQNSVGGTVEGQWCLQEKIIFLIQVTAVFLCDLTFPGVCSGNLEMVSEKSQGEWKHIFLKNGNLPFQNG